MKIRLSFLKFDLVLQSLLLVTNLGFLFSGQYFMIFLLQILIAAYQVLVSALVNLLSYNFIPLIIRLRRLHLVLSMTYLTSVFILSRLLPWSWGLHVSLLLVLPQLIALAYWGLTWLDYRLKIRYLERRPTIFSY